jgi:hypothetical protein
MPRRLIVNYQHFGTIIDPIFEGQSVLRLLESLTLKDGIDSLSRNVGNYQSTLRNIPEERRSHLHSGGSLKARTNYFRFCSNQRRERILYGMTAICIVTPIRNQLRRNYQSELCVKKNSVERGEINVVFSVYFFCNYHGFRDKVFLQQAGTPIIRIPV